MCRTAWPRIGASTGKASPIAFGLPGMLTISVPPATPLVAREIAAEIEDSLEYPGQIKVTVIRESRTSELAH